MLLSWLAGLDVRAEPPSRGYYRHPTLHDDTIVFTAEGDLWKVGLKGGIAQRLTSHPGMESHPAISPDGQTLAFAAEYEGPTEVYTMPLAGGLPTRHTFDVADAAVVGWTSDGQILYRTRSQSTLPNAQLVQLNPRDSDRRRIPLAQASEAAADPADGTWYFTRLPFQGSSTKRYRGGTAQNLWRFKPGDAEAVPLARDYPGTSRNPMFWKGRVYFLSDRDGVMNLWSMKPDGTDWRPLTHHGDYDVRAASLHRGRIVYQQGGDLWIQDADERSPRRLDITLASDFDQKRERWIRKPLDYLTAAHVSPDGDRVALTARGQVFVVPVKSGRWVEIPRPSDVRYRDARFWPDGRDLLALSDETGEVEFWKLAANGLGRPELLTTNATVLRYAGIPSPDGHWLAWGDKDQRLWVMRLGAPEPQLIAQSLEDEITDFSWSPDSRWLAYVETATNTFRQIHLMDVEKKTHLVATSDRVDSYSPAWSADGQWLYFLSDRELRSLVPSPWGPRQPDPFFTETTKIFHLALVPGLRSPFRPKDELAPPEADKPAAPPEKKDKEKDDVTGPTSDDSPPKPSESQPPPDSKPAKPKNAPPTVVIDPSGLPARLEEVPVSAGNYRHLSVTSKHLLWIAQDGGFSGKSHLKQLEISAEDPKTKTLVEDVRSYELSANQRKLLVRKGDAFHLIAADASAPAKLEDTLLKLDGWTFAIQPAEEWRQIYREAWRMIRDHFYDRSLHGVDWTRMFTKYRPLVDRVSDRAELSDILSELIGELSALHMFVRYGDERQGPDQVQSASLGANFTRDVAAGGWRIDQIHQTDPDYPAALSPLLRPGVELQPGDVITRINGRSTLEVPHPAALLRNQAGRQVLLEVRPASTNQLRQAIVKPISRDEDAELRYDHWEYTRRLRVEQAGQGRLGYVHLRAMGAANIAEWARDFYPVFQRPGLIIDVRHNRGGNIDSWILGKLLRKAWFYWQPRLGQPTWNMQYAFRGHAVVICDEFTASDGEAFCEGFRRLGLGKIIGTRTWGGEIWLSARRWLVDNGMASAAETGVYGPEGAWLIEGHGVEPDVWVDNLPHTTFAGHDAQLEAAIQHLEQLIAQDPRPVPPAPPYPQKGLR